MKSNAELAGAGAADMLANGSAPGGGGGSAGVDGVSSPDCAPKLDQLPPKPRPGGCDTAMAASVRRFSSAFGCRTPRRQLVLPLCSR